MNKLILLTFVALMPSIAFAQSAADQILSGYGQAVAQANGQDATTRYNIERQSELSQILQNQNNFQRQRLEQERREIAPREDFSNLNQPERQPERKPTNCVQNGWLTTCF